MSIEKMIIAERRKVQATNSPPSCDGGDHGRYCDPCDSFQCEDCGGAICQDACFHTTDDLIVCHVCATFLVDRPNEDGNHDSKEEIPVFCGTRWVYLNNTPAMQTFVMNNCSIKNGSTAGANWSANGLKPDEFAMDVELSRASQVLEFTEDGKMFKEEIDRSLAEQKSAMIADFIARRNGSIAIQHENHISCEKCKVELHNALYYSSDKMKALSNVLARR